MTKDTESSSNLVNHQFATTHWSIVIEAGRLPADGAQKLSQYFAKITDALYAFVRRRVAVVHEAHDLTQEFFTPLLEKNKGHSRRPSARPSSYLSVDLAKGLYRQRMEERKCQKTRR